MSARTEKTGYPSLSEGFRQILSVYKDSTHEPFEKHHVAKLVRSELVKTIEARVAKDGGTYLVKGSAGQGVWARGPWIAIFNRLVTTSAQSGYYVCFLFREDMTGVYLTLVQAMTEAKRNYRAKAKIALRARASNFRAFLGSARNGLDLDAIDLAPSSVANDTSFYEAGVIAAKLYPSSAIPDDEQLTDDIRRALELYDRLILSETSDVSSDIVGTVGTEQELIEDTSKKKLHYRVERNRKLAAKVKDVRGFKCEACGFDFSSEYGEIGYGYIEAHHLTPLAKLDAGKIRLDPKTDFAVLCSNCHSMIHRSEFVSDIASFQKKYLAK